MLEEILNFFKFLVDIFRSLPEEEKAKIYRKVATFFEGVFREYYQQSQA